MPTKYKGTREDVRALNLFIRLTRATDSFLARLYSHDTTGGLTPTQFGVLEALYHLGPMCHGEIGTKLLKSGGNIKLVIDNLEKAGLVQRERGAEDRRRVTVSLNPQGRERIGQLLPGHVAAIVEKCSVLTAEEQETLSRLCRKLGKAEADCRSFVMRVSRCPLAAPGC